MIKLNSKCTEKTIGLITVQNLQRRLFYALYFEYYETHSEFCDNLPKFSGSEITNLSKKLNVSRKIAMPSLLVLNQYRKRIREHFKVNKVLCEKLTEDYVFNSLITQSSFKIESEKVVLHLKKNRIE